MLSSIYERGVLLMTLALTNHDLSTEGARAAVEILSRSMNNARVAWSVKLRRTCTSVNFRRQSGLRDTEYETRSVPASECQCYLPLCSYGRPRAVHEG
jgi:hypothetical protein